jgi:hypothetical protein
VEDKGNGGWLKKMLVAQNKSLSAWLTKKEKIQTGDFSIIDLF